jgi:hypothetical protein
MKQDARKNLYRKQRIMKRKAMREHFNLKKQEPRASK